MTIKFQIALVDLVVMWSSYHAKGPGSIPGWLIYFLVGIHFQNLFKKLCLADILLLDAKMYKISENLTLLDEV